MANSRNFSALLIVSLLVALAAMGRSACAQEVTASIVGTITDPSGAPVSGATVTATDTERGIASSDKTDETGTYHILRLPISSYTVKVAAAGFQTVTHAAFTLVLNQSARIDVLDLAVRAVKKRQRTFSSASSANVACKDHCFSNSSRQ